MDIVMVGGHRLFAEALGAALVAEGFRVHVVATPDDAVATIESVRPDVVLVDEQGPWAAPAILTALEPCLPSTVRVLLLSSDEMSQSRHRARLAGLDGVISRYACLADLAAGLRGRVGESVSPPRRPRRTGPTVTRHGVSTDVRLTPREVEVMDELARGVGNAVIAQRLGITPNTVRTHVQNILAKLGASSRLEAVTRAIEHDLVSLPLAQR